MIQQHIKFIVALHSHNKKAKSSKKTLQKTYKNTLLLLIDLAFKSKLNSVEDKFGAIVSINSTSSGIKNCDWFDKLVKMYTNWGEQNDFQVKTFSSVYSEEGQLKSVELLFLGYLAYGLLKSESGIHHLVHNSTARQSKISAASISVCPLIDNSFDIDVNIEDILWENTTSSLSQTSVKHIPSGIVVKIPRNRSHHSQREDHLQILKSKVYKWQKANRSESTQETIEETGYIRTYILDKPLVKDNRSTFQTNDIQAILDGNFNPFIKDYLDRIKEF